MRTGRFALALVLAVIAHTLGVRVHPTFAQAVDLFVTLAVLHALDGDSVAGLLGGLAVGMAHDALSGGLFGLFGIADTIVGYGVARLSQRLVIERAIGVFPVAAVAAVFQQVIVVGLALLVLADPRLPDPRWLAARALTTGLVATLLYASSRWWTGSSDRRRRRRREKIQLD